MLKILYHHRTASRDGQAVHIEEMVAALRLSGCEVIVVQPAVTASARFGADPTALSRMRRYLPKFVGELCELAYNVIAYRRLRRAYLEHRPDVLYERHNLYLLAGSWLAGRFKLPYLLEVNSPIALERAQHGGLAARRLARALEVSVWKSADVLLPVTRVLANILAEHGVPRDRMEVIPNGIDADAFAGLPPREEAKIHLQLDGRLVLGFAGFVRPWHGLELVIEFIAQARRPDLLLLIVGDGPARASLMRHAERHGVSRQVRFSGVVPREQMPSHLAAFDIALQPGATPYASPLKLFEYLAAGCAIVAPRQANLVEVLDDGHNALLFTPDDSDALGSALTRLVASPALRERLGAAGRETARRYTWTGNAERVVREARRLCAERSGKTAATAPQAT